MTGSVPQQQAQNPRILVQRVLLLAGVLGVEILVASVYLDGASLSRKPGMLTGLIAGWGAWSLRFAIGFAAVFATFAWLKHKRALVSLSALAGGEPISGAAITLHLFAVPLCGILSAALYGGGIAGIPSDLVAVAWLAAAASAIVSAALAILPRRVWSELLRVTGNLWLLASGTALAACILGSYSRVLWTPTARLTFRLVTIILRPTFHNLVVQPDVMRVGTSRFTAIVTPECSGLEGAALLLLFGVLWLILFRDVSRFPQCLFLLPAAVVVLFLLNAVRIAALIVIGHAGAKDIAIKGFHSQAGWIAFNFVAFGFSAAARRLPWFSRNTPEPGATRAETYNPATAYLLPFLAILGARMISRAISGNFEWFYSLGFFATLAALWILRRRYEGLSWKFGWPAFAGGILVFALWIALDRFAAVPAAHMPAQLAAATPPLRSLWIALRVLAAAVTVPIAEELAFRGYLQRRLVSADFEIVSFRTWTWFSLIASSLAFGAMHGERWLAGACAGLIYGALMVCTGRLGEAIAAHGITNALLAAYILLLQRWQFW